MAENARPWLEIEINGVIAGPPDADAFFDEFVDWLEARKWSFGGTMEPSSRFTRPVRRGLEQVDGAKGEQANG